MWLVLLLQILIQGHQSALSSPVGSITYIPSGGWGSCNTTVGRILDFDCLIVKFAAFAAGRKLVPVLFVVDRGAFMTKRALGLRFEDSRVYRARLPTNISRRSSYNSKRAKLLFPWANNRCTGYFLRQNLQYRCLQDRTTLTTKRTSTLHHRKQRKNSGVFPTFSPSSLQRGSCVCYSENFVRGALYFHIRFY